MHAVIAGVSRALPSCRPMVLAFPSKSLRRQGSLQPL